MTIFSEIGLSQLPRVLGLIDRDPKSKTYGCGDRNYWHYKVIDFPNARLQEAAWVMALAQRLDVPNNPFFGAALLDGWIDAAINFWAERRHGDGSTDESYPYERHFCATAFTLYSITEAIVLTGKTPALGLESTGLFLMRHNNADVANQMACAAEALLNLYLLTKDTRFQAGAESKLEKLLNMQNSKGYFNEYGGFDLGYDSITLSFLASIYKKTNRADIKKAALACIDNMRGYIDEYGYFVSDQMSRRTQFLYPYGFSVFATDILHHMAAGLRDNVILNPAWMDDRYCVPFTANYLRIPVFGD